MASVADPGGPPDKDMQEPDATAGVGEEAGAGDDPRAAILSTILKGINEGNGDAEAQEVSEEGQSAAKLVPQDTDKSGRENDGTGVDKSADSPSPAKLFVGGVSWQMTQDHMMAYFSQYGEVIDATIVKNKVTNQPRGFGFVEFKDPASAEAVLDAGQHKIDGRDVDIKRAVPRVRAPVARKDKPGITNQDGTAVFSSPSGAGGTMPANVATNPPSGSEGWAQQHGYYGGGPGKQLLHAFTDPHQAAALTASPPIHPYMAMGGQSGMMVPPNVVLPPANPSGAAAAYYGSPIVSPVLQHRTMMPGDASPTHGNNPTTVVSAQLANLNLSGISGLASLPNPILPSMMPTSRSTDVPGGPGGMPQVHTAVPGATSPSPQAMSGQTQPIPPQNMPMPAPGFPSPTAQRAMPQSAPFLQGTATGGPPGSYMRAEGDASRQSRKIFVGGLPAAILGATFHEYFLKYGPIADSIVMIDRMTGRSRGFGFVTFENESSVEEVLKDVHVLDNKTVDVKRAEPKDQGQIQAQPQLHPQPQLQTEAQPPSQPQTTPQPQSPPYSQSQPQLQQQEQLAAAAAQFRQLAAAQYYASRGQDINYSEGEHPETVYFEGAAQASNYTIYMPPGQYMGPGMMPPNAYGYMPMNMDGMAGPMPGMMHMQMSEAHATMYGPGGAYMAPHRLSPTMIGPYGPMRWADESAYPPSNRYARKKKNKGNKYQDQGQQKSRIKTESEQDQPSQSTAPTSSDVVEPSSLEPPTSADDQGAHDA